MTLQEYVDSLRGRRIAVLGYGVSNTPLIDLLLDNGHSVCVCDMRSEEALGEAAAKLREAGIRVEIDARDEKLGKKIRDAQLQKVPYMLVIGAKEAENGTLAVRERSKGDMGTMTFEEFIAQTKTEFNPL